MNEPPLCIESNRLAFSKLYSCYIAQSLLCRDDHKMLDILYLDYEPVAVGKTILESGMKWNKSYQADNGSVSFSRFAQIPNNKL